MCVGVWLGCSWLGYLRTQHREVSAQDHCLSVHHDCPRHWSHREGGVVPEAGLGSWGEVKKPWEIKKPVWVRPSQPLGKRAT